MKLIAIILLVLGAVITYGSKKIAAKIFKDKREPNDADIVYIKLVGFVLILAAAIITFF